MNEENVWMNQRIDSSCHIVDSVDTNHTCSLEVDSVKEESYLVFEIE